MQRFEEILSFYQQLSIPEAHLPKDVQVMNPYHEPDPEVWRVIKEFYQKFYTDRDRRGLILGINPGRFGAGITGIPFTDSYRLQEHCGISFPGDTRETSSLFVYDVVKAYGGATTFYKDWYIGAVSPLGFIHKNKKGNWVNWNYYDQKELEKALMPYIFESLKTQKEICGDPETVIVLGSGKNYKFLKKINDESALFKNVVSLEHPRYIMQYKLKQKEEYVSKFIDVLRNFAPSSL